MTIRKRLEVAENTTRQGQEQGQIPASVLRATASKYRVPARWLRLIAEGTIEDPAFVAAIREAAKPSLVGPGLAGSQGSAFASDGEDRIARRLP